MREVASALFELVALPEDRPRRMPGEFYTSQALFELEYQTVLRKSWYCIGRMKFRNPVIFSPPKF